jgi:hypothetical protein
MDTGLVVNLKFQTLEPMGFQAEYIFTAACWSVITCGSNFMFSSCREQSELRPSFWFGGEIWSWICQHSRV